MLKCKSLLDFFKFNSESEIYSKVLITASHQYLAYQLLVYPTSPNLWMMMPIQILIWKQYTCIYLNQHLNDGCKTSSAELPNTDHADMRSSQRNRILLRMSAQLFCMYQNKHLITQKKQTKRHHLFFTPKWKLLNRKAISPQTERADSCQSVF